MRYVVLASKHLNSSDVERMGKTSYITHWPHGEGKDLETLVNDALSEGATLAGGVTANGDIYAQAVIFSQS